MRMQFYSILVLAITGLAPIAGADEMGQFDLDSYQQAIQAFGVGEQAAQAAARAATDEIARRANEGMVTDLDATTPEIAFSANPYSID